MENFNYRAMEEHLGAVGPGSLPVVWAWATHFKSPKKDLAGAMRVLRAPEESAV